MNLFKLDLKLQKTVRVLVYPNITFQKDLEKDSYIQVIKKQIKLLNEIRDDLWFYLFLPCPVSSLNFDNVTQYYIDLPTYPPTMRSHFDVSTVQKLLSSALDFDLIMSHLPEHTHQLVNTMYNVTHHMPPVLGYCHWWDVKQVVTWPKDSFKQNITGLLEYHTCYLNTQHQKDLVLEQAKETFNDRIINRLDKTLTVQHLGVDGSDIVDNINETPEKIIVFNHRPDTYKHFKEFVLLMDKLWKTRKDFKVWVPLLDNPSREYIIVDKGKKEWYYKKLRTCCVGFSPKQTYGGWSVATTDGLMNGVPYIMYDAPYYEELNPTADFFTTDDEALSLLNLYLDGEVRNTQATKSLNYIRKNLIYKDEIIKMSELMDTLILNQRVVNGSERLKSITEWIKDSKSITKKDIMDKLNWGRGIKWTPYRRALMNHPNIFDINDEEPRYCWREE